MIKPNPWNWAESRFPGFDICMQGGQDVICESWWGICQTQLKSCLIFAGQEMGKCVNFAEIFTYLHLSTSSHGKWFSWWELVNRVRKGVQDKPHRESATEFGWLQFDQLKFDQHGPDLATSSVLCINCSAVQKGTTSLLISRYNCHQNVDKLMPAFAQL